MKRKKPIKLKRGRIRRKKDFPERTELIEHVVARHPYWKKQAPYMELEFLLHHVAGDKRDYFYKLLKNYLS